MSQHSSPIRDGALRSSGGRPSEEPTQLNRRQFLSATGAPLLASAATPSPRNLLMIVVDGQRAEMAGWPGKNRLLHAPNIARFAQRSVCFENSFSSHTVCMPSRASLLTGRYPTAHGVWANGVSLRRTEITLAQVLEQHGYKTASAGKLHLEPQQSPDFPGGVSNRQSYYGFQETHTTENRPGTEYLAFLRQRFPGFEKRQQAIARLLQNDGPAAAAMQREDPVPQEATDISWITNKTIDFIERTANSSPFFAFCSFKNLSPPDVVPAPYDRLYRPGDMPQPKCRTGELDGKPPYYRDVFDHQTRTNYYPSGIRYQHLMAAYYGEMSFIDHEIGRILNRLDQLGLSGNTMVVLTADHGLCLGDHWIWRHGPWSYDQVIKVPLLISTPGIAGNRTINQIVESVDIMPAVLEWLERPIPAGVQGRSLLPLMHGGADTWTKDTAWIDDREPKELDFNGVNSNGFRMMVIRGHTWKYVQHANQPIGELYDLKHDPDEYTNLWADAGYRKLRDECSDRLIKRMLTSWDPLPLRKYSA